MKTGTKRTTQTIHPGVSIGHVHLKVADLERALDFYRGVLGLELTQRFGREAAFLSAGGYHHHIGLKPGKARAAHRHHRGRRGFIMSRFSTPRAPRWPMLCAASSKPRYHSTAQPITVSAKRFTCVTRTATGWSFTGTGPKSCGRALPTAGWRCSRARWTSKRCSRKRTASRTENLIEQINRPPRHHRPNPSLKKNFHSS